MFLIPAAQAFLMSPPALWQLAAPRPAASRRSLQARLSAASNIVLFHAYVVAKLSNPPGAIHLPPSLANPARVAYLQQRRSRRPRKATSFQVGGRDGGRTGVVAPGWGGGGHVCLGRVGRCVAGCMFCLLVTTTRLPPTPNGIVGCSQGQS
jgi:hypothetical protein